MNLLNKKFPTEKSPSVIIHLYYLLTSLTFCYIYYHKFIVKADFYGAFSSGGIYAVLNFEAVKPIQFRILIPFIFKVMKLVFSFISDEALFFLLTIVLCYFILLMFYFLLNEYFQSRAHNCWLAPFIIYPMIWNFVIMNGQFFYMDFSVLLIIIIGFILIVKERYNYLLLLFFIGTLNHPSVGYLIIAFLLYNYRNLLKPRTIIYSLAMAVVYVGVYYVMDRIFPSEEGYFVVFNLYRNLSLVDILPMHIIARDFFFNFGGMHFFILIFFITTAWHRYISPKMMINLTILPYVFSVFISFSVEEIRNYIAIIPFIIILCLLYLSTFENSFLKPYDDVKTPEKK